MSDEEKDEEKQEDNISSKEETADGQDSSEPTEEMVFEPDGTGDGTDEVVWADRLKKLKAKLKACETERQEYLEGWQRSRADYVNLKVSEEKAKHEIAKRAEARLILDFLKVADSFELAFSNQEAWAKLPDNWRQGVEYIHSQLKTAMKDNGVKEINPLHLEFDPQQAHSI
ncbi:MAG: nucleotide exchange factor GrpE, partial [Patescibacteria group bacterium]